MIISLAEKAQKFSDHHIFHSDKKSTRMEVTKLKVNEIEGLAKIKKEPNKVNMQILKGIVIS